MKGEVVMKRMYEKPMAYEEVFKANEYIAACITGVIQYIYIEIADYEKICLLQMVYCIKWKILV